MSGFRIPPSVGNNPTPVDDDLVTDAELTAALAAKQNIPVYAVPPTDEDSDDFTIYEPGESSREFYVPTFLSRVAFGTDLDRLEGGVSATAHPVKVVTDQDWVLDAAYADGVVTFEGLTQDRNVYIDTAVNAAVLPGQSIEVFNDSSYTVYIQKVTGVTASNLPRAVAPGMSAELTCTATNRWFVEGGTLSTASVAPTLVTAPVLTGTFRTGQVVDADNGVWNVSIASFRYQWQEDTAGNGTFADIGGATSKTYTLLAAQVGDQVRRRTWATANGLESLVANSNATTSLAVAGSVPVGSGSLAIIPTSILVGGTLSIGTSPSWTNSPTSYQYQWQESLSAVWTNISGATSSTYVVQSGDTDAIRLLMWATNAAGQSASPVTSTNAITAGTASTTMASLLQADMTGTSEQTPNINTGWSFRNAPDPAGWTSGKNIWNAWFHLVPVVGGGTSCRVQVAHIQLWGLRTDGTWVQMLYNQNITAGMGQLYNSFNYSSTGLINQRWSSASTAEGGGGKVLINSNEQILWHGWTSAFYNLTSGGLINTSNFNGGFSAIKARLDPATPELHAGANYVLGAAADQRISTSEGGVIQNIGIGKWKTVGTDWDWYTMTFDETRDTNVWASTNIPFPTGYQNEFGSTGGGESSGGGGSAPTTDVSYDAADYVSSATAGTGLIGKTMTLPSGTNRLLVVTVHHTGTGTITQVQIDGSAMTKLGGYTSTAGGTARQVEIWYRVAPPTGARNMEVWGSPSGAFSMEVMSFSNVDQSSPFRTVGSATTASGTSLDVSTTSGATTDLVLSTASIRNTASVTVGGSETERYDLLVGTNLIMAGATQDGATGTLHSTYSWTGADHGAAAAVAIKAAA